MNIVNKLDFNPTKPAVLNLRKSENTHVLAVGLLQDQVLSKHTTAVPTLLMVLKGAIDFHIEDKILQLKTYDTYPIPPHFLHEAIGKDVENVFVLVKDNHIV